MKICIVGAGASGFAAAITAAEQNPAAQVTILEKKNKPASKIAATGNGRCNITNEACDEKEAVFDFFKRAGIFLRREGEGRYYPISGRAEDVRRALFARAEALGIEILCGAEVSEIEAVCGAEVNEIEGGKNNKFKIKCADGRRLEAGRVLIAAGGKAGPVYGTTGDSFALAKRLGHTVTRLAPALTPLEIKGWDPALKGLRAKAGVTLFRKGEALASESGEVMFTEKGISGICVFNLSAKVVLSEDTGFGDYEVELDLLQDAKTDSEFAELFAGYIEAAGGSVAAGDLLRTVTDERLGAPVLAGAGLSRGSRLSVDAAALEKIIYSLRHLRFTVAGAGGWDKAQCTRGGVVLSEIDAGTMESKLVKGLYIAGEALDYDGPCGGFNLHHSWLTGIKAGISMARE